MHCLPTCLQVLSDGLLGPALEMQPQHDRAALGRVRDLVIGRKAALLPLWERFGFFQHPLNGFAMGPATRSGVTDSRNFIDPQGWMLNLQIDDHLAKLWRKRLW